MELTNKNIEEYINRFMEGETTGAEEQAIYRFFHREDVPVHLKEYAPMFAWYEAGMPEGGIKPVAAAQPEKTRFGLRIPLAVWSAGIAAMIVVTLGLGTLFYSEKIDDVHVDEWDCYEGSYIEVNGKRITDIKQILPIILAEQAEAEQKEKLMEKRIREVEKKEKRIREKEMMVN